MSIFYIIYQVMMMIGTVLGPGSIFIMLAGSLAAATGISDSTSFLVNLVPLILFIITCLAAKTDHQILFAQLLSIAYALVMMAVLVGLLVQMTDDGVTSPTSLSLFFVAGAFILAGFLHPQELKCLPMGVVYYITIPSMYLFLVIYSVFNLNVVSWGTREVPKKKTAEELEEEQKQQEQEAKKKELKSKGTFLGSLFGSSNEGIDLKLRGLFNSNEKGDKEIKNDLNHIHDKLEQLEMAIKKEGYKIPTKANDKKPDSIIKPLEEKKKLSGPSVRFTDPKDHKVRNDLINPYWIELPEDVGAGEIKKLKNRENKFWQELIEQYLKPLVKNADQQKKQEQGLKELRNSMVFSFLMINSIWVLTVFLLQQNKDKLNIKWPLPSAGPIITYDEDDDSIHLEYEYLSLEPIGLIFVIFFAFVMLLQLIGMLAHRLMTLGHIISTTKIRMTLFGKNKRFDPNKLIQKQGVNIVKDIIRNAQVRFFSEF